MPAPFKSSSELVGTMPKVKMAKKSASGEPTALDIVECCYTFLRFNTDYFRKAWSWSDFCGQYLMNKAYKENGTYTLLCNHILSLVSNMTAAQLKQMNKNIPVDVIIQFETKFSTKHDTSNTNIDSSIEKSETVRWNFENDLLTNIEGVMLPIFDTKNYSFFKNADCGNQMVMVESTRLNLRCVAVGIAAGKAVCLAGPVGSGKTTLVEYVARRTGRIPPKFADIERLSKVSKNETKENSSESINNDGTKKNEIKKRNKRKANDAENESDMPNDVDNELNKFYDRKSPPNGFLRIQLGDQTDSKMLLGQYRCTDVPGEFVWQPGVLTQAVLNGYWLLLEDLDLCTQDVCMVLANLLENNYLTVPGFRDRLPVSAGFQLFITLR